MGMTITEKILAGHAGVKKVSPGEIINTRVDVALGNDITAPIAIEEFRKAGEKKYLIVIKSFLFRIISLPTKIFLQQNNALCYAALPRNRI